MGRPRARHVPGLLRVPPADPALAWHRRHDHQLPKPARSHQGMDQRARSRKQPERPVDHGGDWQPYVGPRELAKRVRPHGARRVVGARRPAQYRRASERAVRHPLPRPRQDGRGGSGGTGVHGCRRVRRRQVRGRGPGDPGRRRFERVGRGGGCQRRHERWVVGRKREREIERRRCRLGGRRVGPLDAATSASNGGCGCRIPRANGRPDMRAFIPAAVFGFLLRRRRGRRALPRVTRPGSLARRRRSWC